jgi:hypothetical protein
LRNRDFRISALTLTLTASKLIASLSFGLFHWANFLQSVRGHLPDIFEIFNEYFLGCFGFFFPSLGIQACLPFPWQRAVPSLPLSSSRPFPSLGIEPSLSLPWHRADGSNLTNILRPTTSGTPHVP